MQIQSYLKFQAVILSLLLLQFTASAQQLKLMGTVMDQQQNKPIAGATLDLYLSTDSSFIRHSVSNEKGVFVFDRLAPGNYILKAYALGFDRYSREEVIGSFSKKVDNILLTKSSTTLSEVTMVAKTPPTQQKGDTVQYNASQYKVNPDATVEDLVKKMPGITVDKSGTVTAHGEQVKKVTVDGKDFFGDDATAALRNLPAEVIEKIQVFDKLSEQAAFTGFDDGNSVKALNIVTKTGVRNGQFGRIYAGYGTDQRYAAGGNVTFMKNNMRLALVGLFNNINQQNFSSQDLLGVTGTTGGGRGNRQGGNRGGQGGNQGNSNNFLVGQQNGISTTNATGINYSDQWGKKVQVTGSYFFNNSNTDNNQLSNTRYLLGNGSSQYSDENGLSSANNYNHRINFKMDYKIDSSNSITITPSLNFQKNKSDNSNDALNYFSPTSKISSSESATGKNSNGYNITNNILWRHNFSKKGRTISVGLTTGFNNKDNKTYQQSDNIYYQSSGPDISDSTRQFTGLLARGHQLSASFVYTEPSGKKGQWQISYTPSVSKSKSDQELYHYDFIAGKYSDFDSSLSSNFDNTTTTHNAGLTYRLGDRDNMFAAGVSWQYTQLLSSRDFPVTARIDKGFNNILPNLVWRKKLSSKANIRIMYRASINTPSISQLQDVYNVSNPLNISTGNPDLQQQATNTLSSRYTYTNTARGQSLFVNVFLQQTSHYIANASFIASSDSVLTPTVTLYKGSQLTKPVNLDGYFNMRSFVTYGLPVKIIKSNVNLNAGFTWSRTPGYINSVKSLSNNYSYNAGLVVASNINQYVDFNLSYSAAFNEVRNSIQPALNNRFVNQSAGIQLNLLSKKGWFLQQDVSNQSFSGLTGGFNQSFWLWNAAAGKKILKGQSGEIKLSVFDLLKQNRSITRNATETYIEDLQNTVLSRYFLLTFTYKLKNFGVAKPSASSRRSGRWSE